MNDHEKHQSPKPVDPNAPNSPTEPSALVLGDETNPLVEILPTDTIAWLSSDDPNKRSPITPYQTIPLTPSTRDTLQPLVQCTAALGQVVEQGFRKAYVLRFSPEVTKQLTSGSATIMQSLAYRDGIRATAINSVTKRVIGHGTLVPIASINPLGAAVAIWQVLCIVTAQHYLSTIQQQLGHIQGEISDIKSWLESSDQAKLTNNFKTLHRIKDILNEQHLKETDIHILAQQVLNIDRESGAILEHSRFLMEQTTDKIERLPKNDMKAAHQVLSEYERFASAYLIAASIRATVAQVWCALPLNHDLPLRNSRELEKDVQAWESLWHNFFREIRAWRENVKPPLTDFLGDTEKQATALGEAIGKSSARLMTRFEQVNTVVTSTTKHIECQIAAESQPLELLVVMDEAGTIQHVARPLTEMELLTNLIEYVREIPGTDEQTTYKLDHTTVYQTLTHGITIRTRSLISGHRVFIADSSGTCVFTKYFPDTPTYRETLWKQLAAIQPASPPPVTSSNRGKEPPQTTQPASTPPSQDAESYCDSGDTHMEHGHYDRAIADYTQAIALDPTNSDIYVLRGQAHTATHNYAQALADYNQAIALSPNDESLYLLRGEVHYENGDYDRAIADFGQLITLAPEEFVGYYNRGRAWLMKDVYDRAIQDNTQAINLDPDCAEAYNNRGIAYVGIEAYDQAIADYTQAISLAPDNVSAYYNRSTVYISIDDYNQAIADLGQVIALDSNYVEAFYLRGLCYLDQSQTDQAIADLKQVIALDPHYAEAFYNQGRAYAFNDDLNQAITHLNQAIALEPNYAEAFYFRGLCHIDQSQTDQAIADFKQVIALDPNYAEVYYQLGRAYGLNEDLNQAITHFDQTIALDPNHAEAFYFRGLCYVDKRRTEKASADFQKVLELSNDPDLRQEAEDELQTLKKKRGKKG
jgi:tetratricopeptide (TPR) repeat protein